MSFEPKQITSRIYQGGWILPRDVAEIVRLGITHILNLDFPYENPLPFTEAGITLHNVYIRDYNLMTPQRVREAMAAIDGSFSTPGNKIYIHCNEGVNRSPTIAWLYLIHTGLSPEDAAEKIKAVKIKPNPALYDAGIIKQLIADRP